MDIDDLGKFSNLSSSEAQADQARSSLASTLNLDRCLLFATPFYLASPYPRWHSAVDNAYELGGSDDERERAQNAVLIEQLERKKKFRKMAVPTDDKKVRERLRAYGEPITLFGEGVSFVSWLNHQYLDRLWR